MLLCICCILGLFTISIGHFIQIRFSFLPLALIGLLYGPLVCCICGGISDLLCFMIKPTGVFFPGFTLNAMLTGFIYGIFLYRKKTPSLRCLFFMSICNDCIVQLLLTSIWLSILYHTALVPVLYLHIWKFIFLFPIHLFLLNFFIKDCSPIFTQHIFKK